ncbi:MAG: DUF6798 domain-containing protein [Kofleriaceae bacterium]|nr:DUF6798 domain-containing protein [Kofleriaceae bacterium]
MKVPLRREWLLLGAVAVMWVVSWYLINGYAFPEEDQAIHNSYIVHAGDPTLLTRDLTVANVVYHPSLLWPALAFLLKLLPIEPLYLIIHALSVFAMLLAVRWWAIGIVGDRPGARRAGLIAPLLVLVSHNTLAAIPMMDHLVLPRSMMAGVLFFALGAASRARFALAYALCGAAFTVHATTATHAAFLVFCISLGLRTPWKRLLLSPLWFIALASPLLLQILLHEKASGVPFPPPTEWVELQRLLVEFHHIISRFDSWPVLIPLIAPLVVTIRWRMWAPLAVFAGVVAFSATGYVLIEKLGVPIAFQLHMQEITRFLPYCGAVVVAAWFVRALDGEAHIAGPVLAGAALITGYAEVEYAALAWLVVERLFAEKLPFTGRAWSPRAWTLVAATVAITAFGRWHVERPNVDIAGRDMMAWAKANLPKDALVVIPLDWGPEMHFRHLAERAIFVSLKDGSESTFSLDATREWMRRVVALCKCDAFNVDLDVYDPRAEFIEHMQARYKTIDEAHLRELAREFGVTHAVTRADRELALPVLYSDAEYKIFALNRSD